MNQPQHGYGYATPSDARPTRRWPRVLLAVLVFATLAACGTATTAGHPAPAAPAAPSGRALATTTPPATAALPSGYTAAEWAFLVAYPSTNPDAALKGGYAICTSLEIGMSQPQIIESVQELAHISRESAEQIVSAATTHLCPA